LHQVGTSSLLIVQTLYVYVHHYVYDTTCLGIKSISHCCNLRA